MFLGVGIVALINTYRIFFVVQVRRDLSAESTGSRIKVDIAELTRPTIQRGTDHPGIELPLNTTKKTTYNPKVKGWSKASWRRTKKVIYINIFPTAFDQPNRHQQRQDCPPPSTRPTATSSRLRRDGECKLMLDHFAGSFQRFWRVLVWEMMVE